MTLIVTPGSATADSFVSLVDADAYHLAHGNTAWAGIDTLKEAALRRATAYLSSSFTWCGYRLNRRAQSLAWPRHDVVDRDGDYVPSDSIPSEIVRATCEVALIEIVTPGAMSPSVDLTQRVKRERIDVIDTEYFASSADAARPAMPLVADLISGLLAGGVNALVGSSART